MGDWGDFSDIGAGGGEGGGGWSASSFSGAGGIGTPISSGIMGMIGARKQNELTRSNMEWSFRSSMDAANSAVQRRVADMAAAGLNPMLAIRGEGAAGSPEAPQGGQMVSPLTQGISSALAGAELQKVQAEKRNIDADTVVKVQQAPLTQASAVQVQELTQNLLVERRVLMEEIDKTRLEASRAGSEAWRATAQEKLVDAQRELTLVEAQLARLRVPAGEAEAWKSGTWLGKYVSPWLTDVGRLFGSASSAVGAYAGARVAGRSPAPRVTNIFQGGVR